MSNYPINQFIADVLLDGSLFAEPMIRQQTGTLNPTDFQQRTALEMFLAMLKQHPQLWNMVEQHVDMMRRAREPKSGYSPPAQEARTSEQTVQAQSPQPRPMGPIPRNLNLNTVRQKQTTPGEVNGTEHDRGE